MSILGIITIISILIIGYWFYKSIIHEEFETFYLKSALYVICTVITTAMFLFILTWVTVIDDLAAPPEYNIQSEEYELISFSENNYYLNSFTLDDAENISCIRRDDGQYKFETYSLEDNTLITLISTIKPYHDEKPRIIIYKRAKLNIRIPQKLFIKEKNWRKRQLHYDLYKIEFRIPENGINKSL